MAKLTDRWLRRWSDENGEVCAVIRENGDYFVRTTIWKYGKQYRSVNPEEAKSYNFDLTGDYKFTENEQAKMEHDPFFE
jgi:hypothetical protein